MTRIDAFIKNAQDETVPISTLLREAKMLATELGQDDILKWINLELEGYRKDRNYPEYRSMRGQMKGWNPFHGWIPVLHKSEEAEKLYCTRNASQSVREIEELLSSKSDSYEMPYPTSISSQILADKTPTKLSLFIGRSSLVGILESVRNRLLDWASNLKKRGIMGDSAEFTPEEKKEARGLPKFSIGNIENFHGNVGEAGTYDGKILTPDESFWSKAFWYIVVALAVVVVGNILSALILKHVCGI